jgi:hypothetical protein
MIKSVDGCAGGTMFGAKSVYSQNFGGEVLHACKHFFFEIEI